MSYDISLMDPVTNRVAEVPGHLMIGGTYAADYHPETGTFTPALNTNAELNITYNYSHYYYETYKDLGIRVIYGITGLDSLPMLEKIAENIKKKYIVDGEWVVSKRTKKVYFDKAGKSYRAEDVFCNNVDYVRTEEVEYEISEGETSNYWDSTAANALKPIYQLITLAKMRPDCIWDGD